MQLIPIAGFAGAGKSLAALRLALTLKDEGKRVCVCLRTENPITTALFAEYGIRAEHRCPAEITDADAVIVEFGALETNIKRTVAGLAGFEAAPLTVVVNPEKLHAMAAYGAPLLGKPELSETVIAQLTEADVILLSHLDLNPASDAVRAMVASAAPTAKIIPFSARQADGTDQWLDALQTQPAPAVDIPRPAAALTDYNASLHIAAPIGFFPDRFLNLLGQKLRSALSVLPVPLALFQLATVSEEGVAILSCTDLNGILREDRLVNLHAVAAALHIRIACVGEKEYLCDLVYDVIQHTANALERGIAVVGEYPSVWDDED